MNKLSPTADKGWRSSLELEWGAEKALQYKTILKEILPSDFNGCRYYF